jgi:hypothetical protein
MNGLLFPLFKQPQKIRGFNNSDGLIGFPIGQILIPTQDEAVAILGGRNGGISAQANCRAF